MIQYKVLLNKVLTEGEHREDRTGVGTRSLFGESLEFDLQQGFPIVTGKKTFFRSAIDEFLWMVSGSTNVNDLSSGIWNSWADENGDLGPVYGKQWRAWRGENGEIDQLANLVDGIKNNPYSRRHILSSWNVADLDQMALPPCHCFAQFYIRSQSYVDTQVYIRSNDLFVGCPFDIILYAGLTHALAHVTGYLPGKLRYIIGDAHIYQNHVQQVRKYLSATTYPLPMLEIKSETTDLFSMKVNDFVLNGYQHGPFIPAPVAI